MRVLILYNRGTMQEEFSEIMNKLSENARFALQKSDYYAKRYNNGYYGDGTPATWNYVDGQFDGCENVTRGRRNDR